MKLIMESWRSYRRVLLEEDKPSIDWVKPNREQLEREWEDEVEFQKNEKQVPEDVRQFLNKNFPDKDSWLRGVEAGKEIEIPVEFSKTIRNTPDNKEALLGALSSDSHDPEGQAKARRVNSLFDKGGSIPMPIIIDAPEGYWLIGGKTRLGTARYIHKIPAKVLLLSGDKND